MTVLLHFVRLLAITVWVGGIIFFAFVLAPVAFSRLPSRHMAGIVVGDTLRVLDLLGLFCGLLFCVATALLYRWLHEPSHKGHREIELVLAAMMLLATACLHAGVLPPMERARVAAGGDIEAAPLSNPAKAHFERLHKQSEAIEGAVLLLGLGIVLLLATEASAETGSTLGT